MAVRKPAHHNRVGRRIHWAAPELSCKACARPIGSPPSLILASWKIISRRP